jgi:hypothetical protein
LAHRRLAGHTEAGRVAIDEVQESVAATPNHLPRSQRSAGLCATAPMLERRRRSRRLKTLMMGSADAQIGPPSAAKANNATRPADRIILPPVGEQRRGHPTRTCAPLRSWARRFAGADVEQPSHRAGRCPTEQGYDWSPSPICRCCVHDVVRNEFRS